MQQIKPTRNWDRNLINIPIQGERAVRYPINPPHQLTVSDAVAEYLVNENLATYVSATEEVAEPEAEVALPETEEPAEPEAEVALPETEEVAEPEVEVALPETEEPAEPEAAVSLPETEELAEPEAAVALPGTEEVAEPEADVSSVEEQALVYLKTHDAGEISAIKWIGKETAELLVEQEELSWQDVTDLLDRRQLESLITFISEQEHAVN